MPARRLRADRGVVLAAVAQDEWALEYASLELQGDREVVVDGGSEKRKCTRLCQRSTRADREVVLAAVAQNGWVLEYASPALRAERDVVLAAVAQNGRALRSASWVLLADPEVRLAAELNGYSKSSYKALLPQNMRTTILR